MLFSIEVVSKIEIDLRGNHLSSER